jgi:hypothetical protein
MAASHACCNPNINPCKGFKSLVTPHKEIPMNRSRIQTVIWIHAVLCFAVCPLLTCPLLTAQEPTHVVALAGSSRPASGAQPSTGEPQLSALAERNQALKSARDLHICTQTVFLTTGTLDRALMKQKNWDKLGLNIVNNSTHADLELQVNRVIFTHVHTYILTDKATGIVLASGKVTALDGVIASGPMAEQIVKILSAARLPSNTASIN